MSVWLTIPSARPPEEAEPALRAWRERGYRIALWRDDMDFPYGVVDYIRADPYPGYAVATNHLIADIISSDDRADWCIVGGDDVWPDPDHSAEEIARQCCEYFDILNKSIPGVDTPTFGVMQPTGDRYANGSIDNICGSAWMGREFCLRVNGGRGPLWLEYRHMFVDNELQEVAIKLGILWQRPDLIQLHRHFMRASDAIDSGVVRRTPPPHLREANSTEHWWKYKGIFDRRKAEGFPGHEPSANMLQSD